MLAVENEAYGVGANVATFTSRTLETAWPSGIRRRASITQGPGVCGKVSWKPTLAVPNGSTDASLVSS